MAQISILLCAVYYHGNGWCLFCFSCKRCIPTEFWFSANIRELSFHIIIQKNFHLQAQKKSISCIWSFPAIFPLEKKDVSKINFWNILLPYLPDIFIDKLLAKLRCHGKTIIQYPRLCRLHYPVGSRFSVYQPAVLSPHSIRGERIPGTDHSLVFVDFPQ